MNAALGTVADPASERSRASARPSRIGLKMAVQPTYRFHLKMAHLARPGITSDVRIAMPHGSVDNANDAARAFETLTGRRRAHGRRHR